MALIKNVDEKIIPDQILTSAVETPNSSIRYIGKNGINIVYPADINTEVTVKKQTSTFQ